jgi:hypothetical protein
MMGTEFPAAVTRLTLYCSPRHASTDSQFRRPVQTVKLFIDWQKDRRKLVTTERQPSSPIPPIPAVDGPPYDGLWLRQGATAGGLFDRRGRLGSRLKPTDFVTFVTSPEAQTEEYTDGCK